MENQIFNYQNAKSLINYMSDPKNYGNDQRLIESAVLKADEMFTTAANELINAKAEIKKLLKAVDSNTKPEVTRLLQNRLRLNKLLTTKVNGYSTYIGTNEINESEMSIHNSELYGESSVDALNKIVDFNEVDESSSDEVQYNAVEDYYKKVKQAEDISRVEKIRGEHRNDSNFTDIIFDEYLDHNTLETVKRASKSNKKISFILLDLHNILGKRSLKSWVDDVNNYSLFAFYKLERLFDVIGYDNFFRSAVKRMFKSILENQKGIEKFARILDQEEDDILEQEERNLREQLEARRKKKTENQSSTNNNNNSNNQSKSKIDGKEEVNENMKKKSNDNFEDDVGKTDFSSNLSKGQRSLRDTFFEKKATIKTFSGGSSYKSTTNDPSILNNNRNLFVGNVKPIRTKLVYSNEKDDVKLSEIDNEKKDEYVLEKRKVDPYYGMTSNKIVEMIVNLYLSETGKELPTAVMHLHNRFSKNYRYDRVIAALEKLTFNELDKFSFTVVQTYTNILTTIKEQKKFIGFIHLNNAFSFMNKEFKEAVRCVTEFEPEGLKFSYNRSILGMCSTRIKTKWVVLHFELFKKLWNTKIVIKGGKDDAIDIKQPNKITFNFVSFFDFNEFRIAEVYNKKKELIPTAQTMNTCLAYYNEIINEGLFTFAFEETSNQSKLNEKMKRMRIAFKRHKTTILAKVPKDPKDKKIRIQKNIGNDQDKFDFNDMDDGEADN